MFENEKGHIETDQNYTRTGTLIFTNLLDGPGLLTEIWKEDSQTDTENTSKTTTIAFNKDGTYQIDDWTQVVQVFDFVIKTTVTKTVVTVTQGTWNFVGGIGETKNKESIVLMRTNETKSTTTLTEPDVAGSDTTTVTKIVTTTDNRIFSQQSLPAAGKGSVDNSEGQIYYITQLKNKEMIYTTVENASYKWTADEWDGINFQPTELTYTWESDISVTLTAD